MGWLKKSTRHTYDSNSVHSYYIGCWGGKLVQMIFYSKKFTKYDVAILLGEEPMEHKDCPRNYNIGCSKAIETRTVLELIMELHTLGSGVEFVVSENDITMCAHLYHVGTVNNGKLSCDVPRLSFLYDPFRRIKVLVKDIFGLALMSKRKT